MRRTALVLALLLVTAVAACSVEETMPEPSCEGRRRGSEIIVTQSVPTASLVPCFNGLPDGWDVTSVRVNQDGTRIGLDSDRAGEGAATLRFVDGCDPGLSIEVPSDKRGAASYSYVEQVVPSFRERLFYVFEGGCVIWEFDFDKEVSSTLAVELDESLDLVTRDFVNRNIAENFIDEEV